MNRQVSSGMRHVSLLLLCIRGQALGSITLRCHAWNLDRSAAVPLQLAAVDLTSVHLSRCAGVCRPEAYCVGCCCCCCAVLCQPAHLGQLRGDMQQLSQELHRLEGKGYKAYRSAPAKAHF